MKLHKSYIVLGLVIAFALFCGIVAYADEANEQIKITFNKPVQIPGQVLAPGTYTVQRLTLTAARTLSRFSTPTEACCMPLCQPSQRSVLRQQETSASPSQNQGLKSRISCWDGSIPAD